MAVPKYNEFMKPLLIALKDEKQHPLKEIHPVLAEYFHLTKEDLSAVLPSGKGNVFKDRVGWAKTYLRKAGLIDLPKKATLVITKRGKAVLKENPIDIDNKYLLKFPEFKAFYNKSSKNEDNPNDPVDDKEKPIIDDMTPDEQMEGAYNQINQELADNILDEVLKMKDRPTIFEQFVVDLLEQMGYGTMGFGSHTTKASGDDGIDGVIMQDKLGFSLIYMQAKCWDKNSTVGQPEIQKFLGAIYGKHGDGLFVTTAKFSPKAKDYAQSNHIILIDGEKLARLMIEYNFCVSVRKTFQIKAIDTDALNEYMEE